MVAGAAEQPGRPRRRGRSRWLIAVGVALLLLAVAGTVVYRHRESPPSGCRTSSTPVTTGSPTAAVLGDSYTAGLGLAEPRLAWSTLLGRLEGWRTYAEGISGTGLTNSGFCTHADFGARLPKALAHHPRILVVQGGLNDTGAPPGAPGAALTRLLDRSARVPRLVVVGPPAAPGEPRPVLQRIDAEFRAACRPPHCTYVSALGWQLPFQPDRIHLTPAGHMMFAEHVSEALQGRR